MASKRARELRCEPSTDVDDASSRWSFSSASSGGTIGVDSPAKRTFVPLGRRGGNGSSTKATSAGNMQSTAESRRMVRWWAGRAESCGLKDAQEDRHIILDQESALYCAVFDGHNGSRAAEYGKQTLHRHLLKRGEVDEEAWLRAFASCDAELVELGVHDGSTALAVHVEHDRLSVANCGDSRAVLGSERRAVRLTRDHKPDVAEEKARIEAAGGTVAFRGVWRLAVAECPVMLAVSRALGDRQLKTLDSPHNNVLSSKPEVCKRALRPMDHFLILATDGLWDALSDQEAVACVYDVLGDAIESGRLSEGVVDIAAAALIARATSYRSFDNMTALIIVFQWHSPPPLRTAPANSFRSSRSKKAAGTRALNVSSSSKFTR